MKGMKGKCATKVYPACMYAIYVIQNHKKRQTTDEKGGPKIERQKNTKEGERGDDGNGKIAVYQI